MKPMTLNLSKMKKVSGDKDKSTFLHPDGHQIVIAHGPLPTIQKKQIEKMPIHQMPKMMAGGGFSDGNASNPDSPEVIAQQDAEKQAMADAEIKAEEAISRVAPQESFNTGPEAGAMNPDADRVPADAEASPHPTPNAPPDSVTTTQSSAAIPNMGAPVTGQNTLTPMSSVPVGAVDLNKSYNQGQNAISEEQAVNAAKAKADTEIQTQDLIDRKSLSDNAQKNLQDFTTHQQNFMNDYANNHIDPKHYIEDMSTPQKISTGIGLLLGGFSTAFTHGSNPAMDFLNKQIDRDIAAQQSRQDQKKTLLGANENLYHDKVLGMNQTRVNMNDMYDHQIQLAASKLGTPQAKAMADAAHSKFALENASLLNQNAIRSAVMNHLQQGGGSVNAIDLVNAGIIPKEYQADAAKEQASIDAQKNSISQVRDIFKKINQDQSGLNLVNPQARARVDAYKAQLANAVVGASASKRLTPESAKLEIEPVLSSGWHDAKTRAAQEQTVLNMIEHHADPTPLMNHYAPSAIPSYAPQFTQHRVGDIVVSKQNGQKYQIIDAKGNVRPLG